MTRLTILFNEKKKTLFLKKRGKQALKALKKTKKITEKERAVIG